MSHHIDKWLNAYYDGVLAPTRAKLVYNHLVECRRCQSRLFQVELVGRRLKDSLSVEPVASPREVKAWWSAIRSGESVRVQRRGYQALASVALTLVLMLVPMATVWAYSMPSAMAREGTRAQSTEIVLNSGGSLDFAIGQYPAQVPTTTLLTISATLPPTSILSPAPVPYAPTGR